MKLSAITLGTILGFGSFTTEQDKPTRFKQKETTTTEIKY